MAPQKYKDVGKACKDLINNDYMFQAQKLKIKSKTANGVEFTTEGTLKSGKGVSGKLSAKFTPFEGITISKLCVTTDGRFQTEASLDNALPGAKFTVKAEEGADKPPAGELCVDYKTSSVAFNGAVDVCDTNGPTLKGSCTVGYDNFVAGVDGKYATGFDNSASPSVVDYGLALGYNASDYTVALNATKKCKDLSVSVHQNYSKDIALGSAYNHSSKLLTVAGSYKLDSSTKFTGKINSKGVVSANAIQTISSGVKLISSVEVNAKEFAGDSHKFGLQLVLG